MTSYYVEIKECPDCNLEFGYWGLASSNTFGAEQWTDGQVVGAMHDEPAPLVRCPHCDSYHWIDDLPTIEGMMDSEFMKSHVADDEFRRLIYDLQSDCVATRKKAEWDLKLLKFERGRLPVVDAKKVRGNNYNLAIEDEVWRTESEERYLRIRSWRWFNDFFRKKRSRLPKLEHGSFGDTPDKLYDEDVYSEYIKKFEAYEITESQRTNMERLLELLTEKQELVKAEIYRELGRFEECVHQLKTRTPHEDERTEDRRKLVSDRLMSLAEQQIRRVMTLK